MYGGSMTTSYTVTRNSSNERRNCWMEDDTDDTFLHSLAKTTFAFCNESTLHGVKNIANDIQELSTSSTRRQKVTHWISIFIWITTCILGLIFGLILMDLVWDRFQSTPTITTIETNNYPIWNVKFPAVTICNNNKVYAPATQNITSTLIDLGLDPDRVKSYLRQLVKLVIPEFIRDPFVKVEQTLWSLNYTTERLMFEVMQPCSKMLQNCSWLGKNLPCESLFRVATSSEGFCCSFNYKPPLDPARVDTEHDYIEDSPDSTYRVSGAGQYVGLDLLIRVGKDDYLSYAQSYYGVSILIHGSEDFPQSSDKTVMGQPGCDVTIAVIPSIVVSETSIQYLPLRQRNCYFGDEIKLRTTNKYTYQACISQCAVDTILKSCNCLPFYYPEVHLFRDTGFTRQCTINDVNCVHKIRHIFSSLQPADRVNDTIGMMCDYCKPSCTEENFNVQAIVAKRTQKDSLPSFHYYGMDLSNFVSLKVHFKDLSCIKYRRDVFMTWDGLFAAFGGIFGLCLGGSVISVVEFFYYFTYRLYSNISNKRLPASARMKQSKLIIPESLPHMKMHRNGVNIKRNRRVHQISVAGQLIVDYEKKYQHFLN